MTINIALTSYPRRITNCVKVINSVLENTLQPDRVYLTLSHLEFPNYEQDLPQDLYKLIMTSNKVILNWVEDNYKSMKKVFPILPYLEDDDIIIDIDDDMILPNDFIEARMKDFNEYDGTSPITSNISNSVGLDQLVCQCYSLFQKKMLNGYEKFVNETVLNTFNDDRTYLYLCHLNGYKLKPCTKYCLNKENPNGISVLDVAPRSNYRYNIGGVYDRIVEPVVAELSNGRKICDCFNLFNEKEDEQRKPLTKTEQTMEKKVEKTADTLSLKERSGIVDETIKPISSSIAKLFQYNLKKPIKHDLVYVLGKGSKYDNLEIKISITSVLKFCDDWVGDIYVVGENPRIRNPRIKHIYASDITRGNKDANIIHKIRTAIDRIPTLTENFLFCSDDILVTKKSKWEDFAPRYVFEYRQDDQFRQQLYNESKNNEWDKFLLRTLDRFIGYREHIYFYEPHIFAPINKRYFRDMCRNIDYTRNKNVMIMSLWFNWMNLNNPPKKFDHTSVFTTDIPSVSEFNRHLTYNDIAFSVKEFRDNLIKLVTMDDFN